MHSKQISLKSAALLISLTIVGAANAQQATNSLPSGDVNTQKAAENFEEAMEISTSMELTGAAAKMLKLNNDYLQATLEAKTEKAKTDLIEARINKSDASRRYQASLFGAAPAAQSPQVSNALPEVPGAGTTKTTAEPSKADAETDEKDKDKEDVFEHSPLPTIRLISGSGDKYRAIVTKSNGAPETIYAGDKIGTWTVRDINTSGVIVVGGDKAKTVEHLSFAAN